MDLNDWTETETRVCCLQVSLSGVIAVADEFFVYLLKQEGGRYVLRPLGYHERKVNCLVFAADQQHLISIDFSGLIKLWDLELRTLVQEGTSFQLARYKSDEQHALSKPIHDATCLPGNTLVLATNRRSLDLLTIPEFFPVKQYKLKTAICSSYHTPGTGTIATSPDGSVAFVMAGKTRQGISAIDLRDGGITRVVERDAIIKIACVQNYLFIFYTVSNMERIVEFWSTEPPYTLSKRLTFHSAVMKFAVHPTKPWILVSTFKHGTQLWDFEHDRQIDRVSDQASNMVSSPQSLTQPEPEFTIDRSATHHAGCLAWLSEDEFLIGWGKTLQFWRFQSADELSELV